MDNTEDLDSFLRNVDKISQLVEGLRSSDVEVQEKAVAKADCYIAALDESCRTKVNKTTVNTNPPVQSSLSPQNESPENFMKIMEKDAEDRRIKKTAKVKKATALKDKGNEAYAEGDYETAVKFYSEGLAELKDMQPLYTNRAQAYIKLKRYKEAIDDCEWALKCNERCIKAYLHMGKAYHGLKKYNEAKKCFEKIQEIEPGKKSMVKEYLDLVAVEEERESQEMNARQEFVKGKTKATAVPQLLEKLSRTRQVPLDYCGGLELLSQAATDCTGQTLFRLNNGFSIISNNDAVMSCLLQKTNEQDSHELCASVLKLWTVVCWENDENQRMLMTCPVMRRSLVELVTSEHPAVGKECLGLLCSYSKTSHGRRLATDNLNLHMLVRNLMLCISEPKQQQEKMAVFILENLAAEDGKHRTSVFLVEELGKVINPNFAYNPSSSNERYHSEFNNTFCIQLRDVLKDCAVVPFTTMLGNINKSNQQVLPSLISAFGRLARDDVICQNLSHNQECWNAFLIAIKQCSASEYTEILYHLLGLIINLSTISSPAMQEHAVSLCECCLDLLKNADGGIITRATGVLSSVLPQSSEAVQHVTQRKVIQTMCWLLKGKGQTATKYAIKTMTVCTAASDFAREELLKSDEKLSILRNLLNSSCDDMISGNAALCLAHCFQLEGVATRLLGTDIVLLLLRLAAEDSKKTAVQQNAAIALGKLCQSEPRHIHKLRELHGLEILHSCAKFMS